MPVNFVTGLPRQGKTLFAFIEIQRRAKEENRPVYYCNIPAVTLPGWVEVDHPDKWMDLPNDSIVVVDELQDFWPAASTGSKVPLPILELSKHGKRGIDFYFITQDPTLVHNTPRKLCETHWYVVRAFGSESAIAYKFRGMQTDPGKVVTKAEKYPWRYPKDAFGKKDKAGNWISPPWYKSADVHNIKRRIPLKLWAIPFAIIIAVGAGWFAISSVMNYGTKMASVASSSVPGAARAVAPGTAAGTATAGVSVKPSHLPYEEWLALQKPRIEGFPHTAPVYDSVTQPVIAPRPAACVQMGKACKCYTQQATLMQVSGAVCLQIVAHGFFQDWREEPPASSRAGAQNASSHAAQRPIAPEAKQIRTVPMPEPKAQQPGQITQADIPQALGIRNPAFNVHPHNSGNQGGE
jgi:zona occludens toxin